VRPTLRNLVPNNTITLFQASLNIIVLPFGSFLAFFQVRYGPLKKLDLTILGPAWKNSFHFFDSLIADFEIFDCKILLGTLDC